MSSRCIFLLMARPALHSVLSIAQWAALDVLCMRVAVVSLERPIPRGMAVHAAGVKENRECCRKCRASAGIVASARRRGGSSTQARGCDERSHNQPGE